MRDTVEGSMVGQGQALMWGGVLVIGILLRLVMRIAAPAPAFSHVQPLPPANGECRVEVWLNGKSGDSLTRLTDYGKHGERWTTGVALVRATGMSPELPTTAKTAAGACRIGRYHLLVGGVEVDTVTLE